MTGGQRDLLKSVNCVRNKELGINKKMFVVVLSLEYTPTSVQVLSFVAHAKSVQMSDVPA